MKRPATRGERVAGGWVVTDRQTLRSYLGDTAIRSREPSLDRDVEVSELAFPALSESPRTGAGTEPPDPRVGCDFEVSEPVVLGCAVAVAAPAMPRPVSAAAKAKTFQGAGRVMLCSFSSGPRTSRISPDSVSAVIARWDENEHPLTRVASRPERRAMR